MSIPMVLEPPSDAELMTRVREGDRDAFTDLVDRHKDAVVSYLTRLTGNRDRAGGALRAAPPGARPGGHRGGLEAPPALPGAARAARDRGLVVRRHRPGD